MSEALYTDGRYLEHNPHWHVQDSPWKAGQIVRALDRAGLRPRRIAEIGCGAGEILRQLALRLPEAELVGYDISPQAIEIARSTPAERVEFRLADMLAEPEGAGFDLVLCIDVFEHVEDYFGFLRKLRGRGTHTLFHIPLNLSVGAMLDDRRIVRGRASLGHIQYFTKGTALATLQETGYEVVDHFYTAGSMERPNRKLRHHVAAVPRRLLFGVSPDFAVRMLGGYSLMVLAR